ncbi:MAG: CPBP family intramembrane metalloprotease, partial [Caldilineaceae bacterium]|nr:CPBP family intramembrane metalloprotease [Caldilineaceae bacterium]
MKLNNLKESPLVQGATEAKRPTRWWVAILFTVIVCILILGTAVSLLVGLVYDPPPNSIGAQLIETAMMLVTFLAVAAWVRFKEGRPVNSLGFRGSGALRRFVIGVAIGAGLLTVSVLLIIALGQYEMAPPVEGGLAGIAALLPALILLVAHWTVQSSTEETLMRGFLVQTNALQMPGWLAILIPGIIFSLLHISGTGFSEPISIINILFFALFTSFIALRQGSLWMVCGIHTGWNWCQGNLFGVPVSGHQWDTGVFHFVPTETAAHALSGGDFGPENSLVVTIVWGIAMVVAYLYFR